MADAATALTGANAAGALAALIVADASALPSAVVPRGGEHDHFHGDDDQQLDDEDDDVLARGSGSGGAGNDASGKLAGRSRADVAARVLGELKCTRFAPVIAALTRATRLTPGSRDGARDGGAAMEGVAAARVDVVDETDERPPAAGGSCAVSAAFLAGAQLGAPLDDGGGGAPRPLWADALARAPEPATLSRAARARARRERGAREIARGRVQVAAKAAKSALKKWRDAHGDALAKDPAIMKDPERGCQPIAARRGALSKLDARLVSDLNEVGARIVKDHVVPPFEPKEWLGEASIAALDADTVDGVNGVAARDSKGGARSARDDARGRRTP